MKRQFVPCPNWCFCNISDYYNKYYYYYKNPHIFFTHCTATAFCPTHRGAAAITVRTKDYRGICRLLSYMNTILYSTTEYLCTSVYIGTYCK